MPAPSEVLTAPVGEPNGAPIAAPSGASIDAPIGEDSDEALMLSYAAGRAAAFDTLYVRHKGGVYRYLLRHCGNPGIADELFQDVWMNAIRARERYTPSAKFTTWLYTLAHHRMIDHWRASGRAKFDSIDDQEGEGLRAAVEQTQERGNEPEVALSTQQLRERLRAALATLSVPQQDAFLLQQEGGLSLAEIAQLTGVGQETVKSRLRYAVCKLRAELATLREELR